MGANNEIEKEISVLKGDKLFNQNTPFIININTPKLAKAEKKSNADLICVIDISYSMSGKKIELVKKSLKVLVKMMDEHDRLALVLFESKASIFFDLDYMIERRKNELISKINEISVSFGTNILSGLKEAIGILKKIKNDKKDKNEKRASSILLLSDGCDNDYKDANLIGQEFKNLYKGENLSFTLNTFGYGDDHDPKIMNKLANIRDGSFFYVQDFEKVSSYFVTVLGGCVSVISEDVKINIKLLNQHCEIVKVFGEDNMYYHELEPHIFKTKILQLLCDKEYTFVLEIKINEKEIKVGEDILYVEVIHKDMNLDNKFIKKKYTYKYQISDPQIDKANEEYIRSQVYFILDEALKLRENHKDKKAKDLLTNMEDWIKKNYKGNNKFYLEDILKSKRLFEDDYIFQNKGIAFAKSNINQKIHKRFGNDDMYKNCNMEYYCEKALYVDDDDVDNVDDVKDADDNNRNQIDHDLKDNNYIVDEILNNDDYNCNNIERNMIDF